MLKRIPIIACWSFTLLLTTISAIFPISSGDIWWHIATGDYILAHRSVPKHDVFSFSSSGRPWITHEWLFEVLLSLLFRLGGTTALILLKTGLVLTTFAILTITLRYLKVDTLLAVLLLLISIPLLTFRAFVRPHVATETLLALYVFMLFFLTHSPKRNGFRWPWFLIPIQLLWVNFHSGGIFGPLLFIAAGTGTLVLHSTGRGHPETNSRVPLRLLSLGGILLVISLLNPNGWRSLVYPFLLARSRTFASAITELWSPLNRQYWSSDFFICLLLLIALGLGSLVLNRERKPVFCFLFGVSAVAGLLALRNIPLFAIISVPIVGTHLHSLVTPRLKATRHLLLWLIAAVSATLLVRTLWVGTKLPGKFRKVELGIEERLFPIGAAEFVAKNHQGGNIFNTMEYGGYLIWRLFPKFRVYVDGRLDVYGDSFFEQYRQALWSGPQFDTIVDKYHIDCALVTYPPSLDVRTERYLGRTLALRPDWSLVYWDDNSLVYFRHTEKNRHAIEEHRLSAIIPLLLWPNSTISSDTNRLITEALRSVSAAPRSSRTHAALGLALLQAGRCAEAAREFGSALALDPANLAAAQGQAMAAARSGDLDGTIAALKYLLQLAPQEPLIHYNLGYALLQRGDTVRARHQFEKSLRLNSSTIPAHNALAELALAEGDTSRALNHTNAVLRLDPANRYAVSRLQRLRNTSPRSR